MDQAVESNEAQAEFVEKFLKWMMLPRWMRKWKPQQEYNKSVECQRRLRQMRRKNGED